MSKNITLTLLPGEHPVLSTIVFGWGHWTIKAKDGKATLACGPVPRNAYNIEFRKNSYVMIHDIVFSDCKVHLKETNNTILNNSIVFSRKNGKFEFSSCHNVTIDQTSFGNKHFQSRNTISFSNTIGTKITRSKFMNNASPSYQAVIAFSGSIGTKITRSKFMNHVLPSRQAVIAFSGSSGMIKCCNFTSNTVFGHDSAIIKSDGGSQIYISNTTFQNNSGIRHIRANNVMIISSVFINNKATQWHSSIIAITNYTTLLANSFINNVGTLIRHEHGTIIAECSYFSLQRKLLNSITHSYRSLCEHHSPGAVATCNTSTCDGKLYQFSRTIVTNPLGKVVVRKSEMFITLKSSNCRSFVMYRNIECVLLKVKLQKFEEEVFYYNLLLMVILTKYMVFDKEFMYIVMSISKW